MFTGRPCLVPFSLGLSIAAISGTAVRFCQGSKIDEADAGGVLDRFWPPRIMIEREPNSLDR